MRYPIAFLYALAILIVTAGFCALLLLTGLNFLNLERMSPEIRVEGGAINSTNTPPVIASTSLRIETSDSNQRTDTSKIISDNQFRSSQPSNDTDPSNQFRSSQPSNDTDPSEDVGPTRIAMPTVLPDIEKRIEIMPLTIEISVAALTADYQSLIASGKTTSEAIRIIDQYVSGGKYGVMGERPTTLESAESVFLSDYNRLISTGITADEAINQLMENVPTGRYGIYADALFRLLEDDLNRR
jgi:hypothetical protein